MMSSTSILTALLTVSVCSAHGHLAIPVPRTEKGFFVSGASEPIGINSGTVFEYPDTIGQAFVCRSAQRNPTGETWAAGSNVNIESLFRIPHPGSCELFLSYDINKSRRRMQWFKIGNWKDCGINRSTPFGSDFPEDFEDSFSLYLPDWLPAGDAVFRFMWSAMHNAYAEYYVDCADVTIENPSNAAVALPEFVVTYPMIRKSPWQDGINLWQSGDVNGAWGNPQITSDWVCGPPCAEPDAEYNQCAETAAGTRGYIDISEYASPGSGTTTSSVSSGTTTTLPISSGTTTTSPDDEITTTSFGDRHDFPSCSKTFGFAWLALLTVFAFM